MCKFIYVFTCQMQRENGLAAASLFSCSVVKFRLMTPCKSKRLYNDRMSGTISLKQKGLHKNGELL